LTTRKDAFSLRNRLTRNRSRTANGSCLSIRLALFGPPRFCGSADSYFSVGCEERSAVVFTTNLVIERPCADDADARDSGIANSDLINAKESKASPYCSGLV